MSKSTTTSKAQAIDKIVLLLISGISQAQAADYATSELHIPRDKAKGIVTDARRKITRAADVDRDHELGTAISRYRDLYARAIKSSDLKTALAAQTRLDKLLALYDKPGAGTSAGEEEELLALLADADAARELLETLNFGADLPLAELARLVVAKVQAAK